MANESATRSSLGKGVHHLGLATHDMEATLEFYENVLGFPAVVCEMIEPETGGTKPRGVKVRGIVDHGWCQSIYFRDPNFLQLEFCCVTEDLGEEHCAGRLSPAWKRLARPSDG